MTLSHSWRRLASRLLTGLITHPSAFRNFSDSSGTKASVTVFMSHDQLVETVWSVFCAQKCGKLVFACTERFSGCLLSSTPSAQHALLASCDLRAPDSIRKALCAICK